MRSIFKTWGWALLLVVLPTSGALAFDHVVYTTGDFSTALAAAQPGDFISL